MKLLSKMSLKAFLARLTAPRLVAGATIVAATMIVGFNCSRVENGSPVMAPSSHGGSAGDNSPPLASAFMSGEQILKMMISVTGIESVGEGTAADDEIASVYRDRSGSLPSGQDLKLATSPTMVAVTNLAGAVCAKAVDNERGVSADQRMFFVEMDFTKGLSAQTAAAVRNPAERLARNAWRRDVNSDDIAHLDLFASEFLQASTRPNDPAQTRDLAIAICAAVLSSIDSLTY